MFGEISWSRLDDLVECYAVLSAHQHRYLEIEHEIVEVCQNFGRSRPAMSDFSYLLNTRLQGKEETVRKISWLAQHIFRMRTWCVGQKIVFQRRHGRELGSPILSQLGRLGFEADPTFRLTDVVTTWARNLDRHDKLDALLADPAANSVCLVKGISYSQARNISRTLSLDGHSETLFGGDGRILRGAYAPAEAIAALLFARDIIKAAFPKAQVNAFFIVVDDPECGWSFQTYSCSQLEPPTGSAARYDLDELPSGVTHLHFKALLKEDPDAFGTLPKWAPFDFLHAAPIDRPTRCIMLMEALWDRQVARKDSLYAAKASELGERVQDRYKIEYPSDLLRHDLEDCLERGGFVRRASFQGNTFALLPKGIARLLLIKKKFNPMISGHPSELLEAIATQAKLWAAAPVL